MKITLDAAQVAAITQKAADAAPTPLQPKWISSTWKGEFGGRGFHIKPNQVTSTIEVGDGWLKGSAKMSGDVTNTRGVRVGDVTRTVKQHVTGRTEVHHDYLKLGNSTHRTGFARAFNDHAFARYEAAGVDDVTILAALSVGGYAWAKQGFELAISGVDEGERALNRARVIRGFVDQAHDRGKITDRQYNWVSKRLVGDDGVIKPGTLTSVQQLAKIPNVGAKVLLGQSWNGVRELKPVPSWWKATQGRVPMPARHLDDSTRPNGLADASAAVRALLPDALDPARALPRFTGAPVRGGLRLSGDRANSAAYLDLNGANLRAVHKVHVAAKDGTTLGSVGFSIRREASGDLVGELTSSTGSFTAQQLTDVETSLRRSAHRMGVRYIGRTTPG